MASVEFAGLPIIVPSSSCALVSPEITRSGVNCSGTCEDWSSRDEKSQEGAINFELRKATILAFASSNTKSGPEAVSVKVDLKDSSSSGEGTIRNCNFFRI